MHSSSICSSFSAIATRFGNAQALICDGARISYTELDSLSTRISRQLRRAGLRKGQLVGLFARRSIEATAAILGILKAGGAYVPLDISYPSDLLRHICRDSDLRLTLVEPALLNDADILRFWEGEAYGVSLAEGLIGLADDVAGSGPEIGPDDLAYVMYTSGSTGLPKGVLIPHRGVVRLVTDCNFAQLGPEQVILHLAPLSFDASTFEIWGALLNGGALAITPAPHPSLDDIARSLRENGVTTLWLTAGLFHLMVENRLDGLRGLGQLIVGGDVLSPPHIAKALEALPDCRIVNGYGPTENTTFTCCYTIPRRPPPSGSIPIGLPIQGTTIHILDADGRPVELGEEGELYTGGAGVALGYLNQPTLTSETFVEDLFAPRADARLYRTGDRVRQRHDGAVEFLGRVDRQIKLNGKRIELDAVEAHLRAEESVQDAAVIAHTDPAGRRSVAAFVTPMHLDPAALRRSLRARLPDFMVPASITALDSLPLSPNGKVDRQKLAKIELAAETAAVSPARPLGATQIVLRRIVADALGHEAIEADQNFFDLGATSLDLIAIHAKIVERFGAVLTPVDLFDHPNIKAVAAKIDGDVVGGTTFISAADRARGRALAMRRAQRASERSAAT